MAAGIIWVMRARFSISPQLYAKVALVALGALALIVLTGAGVRLTGSGLGCPDWPKCYGQAVPPLDTHAVIEYGNRVLTGFVGLAVIAASVLAWFRKPFRWHLALFGALLPLGVIGQAILGALVVKYHLAPGLVMSHFILSMLVLDASFALAWCSRYEPWERRRSSDPAMSRKASVVPRTQWFRWWRAGNGARPLHRRLGDAGIHAWVSWWPLWRW